MKLRIALLALAALGGAALSTGTASAMPLAPLGQFQSSNVENVAVVCGPRGCLRTRPVYRRGGPTSSVAPMYVAAMDTIGAIVGTNLKEGFGPLFSSC
ncbi:sugar/nucleoside kinase (ribokinase family) [Bradyrhizobium sp. LM6.9]